MKSGGDPLIRRFEAFLRVIGTKLVDRAALMKLSPDKLPLLELESHGSGRRRNDGRCRFVENRFAPLLAS